MMRYGVLDLPTYPVKPFSNPPIHSKEEDASYTRTEVEKRLRGKVRRELTASEVASTQYMPYPHSVSAEFVGTDPSGTIV